MAIFFFIRDFSQRVTRNDFPESQPLPIANPAGTVSFSKISDKCLLKQWPQADLIQIKCYRGWEVDEVSADTLTHIHGYCAVARPRGRDRQTGVARYPVHPAGCRRFIANFSSRPATRP
jgi:hypothetical protein